MPGSVSLLENKIAVITGNPYGIGRVSAALFEREGARVVCIDGSRTGWASRDTSKAEAPHFLADVSDSKAVAAVVAECRRMLDRVDILLNLPHCEAELRSNQRRSLEPDDRPQPHGRVHLLAAVPAPDEEVARRRHHPSRLHRRIPWQPLAAYSAGKGGLMPLTHVMAHDLGKYGIRVNCISAGGIRDGAARPEDGSRVRVTPVRRTGTPEDVARVALFRACELSSYVNGANIVVDGGRTAITQGCYDD